MHPEDREFVASSLPISLELQESLPYEKAESVLINIYLWMLAKNKKFRWVLMQFSERLYNESGKLISTLILITNLSHFSMDFSRMMTLIDASKKENIFFANQVDNRNLVKLKLPQISKENSKYCRWRLEAKICLKYLKIYLFPITLLKTTNIILNVKLEWKPPQNS